MRVIQFVPLLLLLTSPALAADWPQWLGPKRDGTSTEKLSPWKGDLKAAWRAPVGEGHSSPIIVNGKVYLHAKVKGKEAEELLCFDSKTGKPLWNKDYPRAGFKGLFGNGPQATPAFADGKVYTFGITGVLTCFDAETGSQVWQVDTVKELKAPKLFFGAACSPLVDGDKVVLNLGAKGASVVAFSKDKGAVVWKSLDDGASYSSGVAHGKDGDKEYIFLTQLGVRGLASGDGKKLWEFPLRDKLNESSTTPVFAGDLLLASSVTFGMVGLKVERNAGTAEAKQAWKNPKLNCYFSTPIPVGQKHVYVVTGQASLLNASSSLHCVEIETGKILWTEPKVGKYHAAMLRTANDKLLLLSDLGDLVLFDPDPTKYKELARSKVVKGEGIWAHPALVDGKVYFRDDKELICLPMSE